jgi:hypothetical protein
MEDLQLVPEQGVLEIQLVEAAADGQAEEPAQKPISDGPEHPGSVTAGRQAGERPGRSADRVSLPHTLDLPKPSTNWPSSSDTRPERIGSPRSGFG